MPPLDRRSFVAFSALSAAFAVHGAGEPAALARVRERLADAFARKDLAAADPLISDPWSGMRFCKDWPVRTWREAGQALRHARWASGTAERASFTVAWPRSAEVPQTRTVHFVRLDGAWKLDLASLFGPFPHP